MINPVFIITDNYSFVKENFIIDSESRVYLSYLADLSNVKKFKEAYEFFSGTALKNLSLTIRINTTPVPDDFQDIISLFFIPAYYHQNNQLILNLVFDEPEIIKETISSFNKAALLQGIFNVRINLISSNEIIITPGTTASTNQLHPLFKDVKALVQYYSHILNNEPIEELPFFLYDLTGEKADTLYLLIRQAEEEMKKYHPFLYDVCGKVRKLAIGNSYLKMKCALSETELEYCKTHLEILRSSHQAKELQEYYNKEYEILPLWYKRAGHLLKALMGKRSFRSLFSTNHKKLKD